MLNLPERVTGISHPLVKNVYLKKDLKNGKNNQNVLIIEALNPDHDDEDEIFDSYLIDLLADLEELRIQAQRKVGEFCRIDIRSH